jgi:hypothetical protein
MTKRAWRIAVLAALTIAAPASAQKEPAAARGQGGLGLHGRIVAVRGSTLEIQTGLTPVATAAAAPRALVTVTPETRLLRAERGQLADVRVDDLVALAGAVGADGRLAATSIVRLWPATGEPTAEEARFALAAAKGARALRRPAAGGKATGILAPLVNDLGPKKVKPTGETEAEAAARRAAARPMLARVVATAPLRILRSGQPVEVIAGTETTIAVMTSLRMKDLEVGDGVAVVGPNLPRTTGQLRAETDVAVTAQAVIQYPGQRGAGAKRARANRAAVKARQAERRRGRD